jgi:hypothetical protein
MSKYQHYRNTENGYTKIIDGYSQWVEGYMDNGWKGFLVTFMFRPLGGGDRPGLTKMVEEVDRVYSTFITRVVRKPNCPAQKALRPILIAVPDVPVFKHERQQLKDIRINEGVHMHGILLVPKRSRLKEGVKRHFKTHEDCYIRNNLWRLDLQRIRSNPNKVVGYAMKAIKNSVFSYDNILVFPKAETEVRRERATG